MHTALENHILQEGSCTLVLVVLYPFNSILLCDARVAFRREESYVSVHHEFLHEISELTYGSRGCQKFYCNTV